MSKHNRQRDPLPEPTGPVEPPELGINPALGDIKSTEEALSELRQRALKQSESGGEVAAEPSPRSAELAKRRRSSVAFFFEQRSKEYKESVADVTGRRREVDSDQAALNKAAVDDLVEFLSLMPSGAESLEAREAMAEHGELLERLGVTIDELIAAARRRG